MAEQVQYEARNKRTCDGDFTNKLIGMTKSVDVRALRPFCVFWLQLQQCMRA